MNKLDEYEKIVIDVAFDGKKPTGIKFECMYSESSEIIHGEPAYVFNVIGDDPLCVTNSLPFKFCMV
jgi:hypothetical protein